jgi:hypothetical protein
MSVNLETLSRLIMNEACRPLELSVGRGVAIAFYRLFAKTNKLINHFFPASHVAHDEKLCAICSRRSIGGGTTSANKLQINNDFSLTRSVDTFDLRFDSPFRLRIQTSINRSYESRKGAYNENCRRLMCYKLITKSLRFFFCVVDARHLEIESRSMRRL